MASAVGSSAWLVFHSRLILFDKCNHFIRRYERGFYFTPSSVVKCLRKPAVEQNGGRLLLDYRHWPPTWHLQFTLYSKSFKSSLFSLPNSTVCENIITSYLLIIPETLRFIPHSAVGQWFIVMSRRAPRLPEQSITGSSSGCRERRAEQSRLLGSR